MASQLFPACGDWGFARKQFAGLGDTGQLPTREHSEGLHGTHTRCSRRGPRCYSFVKLLHFAPNRFGRPKLEQIIALRLLGATDSETAR